MTKPTKFVRPERKRNALLDTNRFIPLIKIRTTELTPVAHMIKPKDWNFLSEVVGYLARNGATEVYLGGSAPENWVFKGKREYGDLDLIAANPQGDVNNEFRQLVNRFRDVKADNPGILNLGSGSCYVKDMNRGGGYLDFYSSDLVKLGASYRFVEIPSMDQLDTTKNPGPIRRACPVEVSFFLNSGLEETIRGLQKIP
jgi:hypothetical protein